ncbi:conserved membrane hypothetical protein [Candidatus Accumulibacter aalborgensis]|uniref:Uncharacterized protein n=2 Tax=Candidatus Accumulibacter aalborgensis TaxID=1860102 RepID=A0A1A8XHA7_9PROT|nr:conserved membrane hypothetical protein [Candidatus Accumulibacter aalborgensis]
MTQVLVLTILVAANWRHAPEIHWSRKVAYLILPWAVVAIAAIVHLKIGESTGIRIENHPGGLVILDRASRIFSMLERLLLMPYPLGLYHDVYRMGEWHWLTSGIGLLLVLLALGRLLVRPALWPLGVVLTVTPWVVYLQIIPFTTWSMASERFLFVSVGGLALVFVDVISQIGQPRWIVLLLLLLTVPMGVITWMRMGDWESGRSLHAKEYERQPHFHNAIRDQVIYTLLPNHQFADAESLAKSVPRDYGAAALVAAVDAERALAEWKESRETKLTDFASGQAYCQKVASLRQTVATGYARIAREKDISYNNFLRSIERQAKFRFANSTRTCAYRAAATH